MTVYVVADSDLDVVKVFSKREKAEEWIDALQSRQFYTLIEVVVDEP